jgi:hypothetical protein
VHSLKVEFRFTSSEKFAKKWSFGQLTSGVSTSIIGGYGGTVCLLALFPTPSEMEVQDDKSGAFCRGVDGGRAGGGFRDGLGCRDKLP